MKQTVTLQIGNSDDKLSQAEWAKFVKRVYEDIQVSAKEVHFSGASLPWEPWQNACFVFVITPTQWDVLGCRLKNLRQQFGQDSIAATVGATEFI